MNDPALPVDLAAMDDQALADYFRQLDAEDQAAKDRLDAPDALARAARWYALNNIAVFPLRPGGKLPLIRRAHPEDLGEQRRCKRACGRDGHGLYDATTDLERIASWWQQHPTANIGLPTGLRFDVLDLDGPTGVRSYTDLMLHGGCPQRPDGTPACCDEPDATCAGDPDVHRSIYATARTRGDHGGQHLYVPVSGRQNGVNVLPGIDLRARGGYVVAPPSRGSLGRYAWLQPLDPTVLPPADTETAA